MNQVLQDLRFSARTLFKSPAFTIVAVVSLALGIGANTTIFSLVNALFLNPMPVHDPSRLYSVETVDATNPTLVLTQMSYPNFEDYRDDNEVFDGLVAWGFPFPTAMLVGDEPEQIFTESVSGNYFRVLGVEPALGRFITPEEDRAEGASPVVVLSHRLWSRRFGEDPQILDRLITINGVKYDVIGVAPKGFQGVNALFTPDVWVPIMMYRQVLPAQFHPWLEDRRALFVSVAGRMKAGVTVDGATAHMKTLASALEQEFPEQNSGRSLSLRPLSEATIFPQVRGMAIVGSAALMTIVALVLLVACFNVANLMMAKASARRREIAVRLSLGAGRARLIRQLLTESTLLGLMGGLLGLVVAFWGNDLIWSMRPSFIGQNVFEPTIDGRVLVFTLFVSLVTGAIFGLIPAIQSSRPRVVEALKEETRTAGRSRGVFTLRNALVVGQVALSIVALVAAGLFLRSLEAAHEIDPGFETEKLAVVTVNPGQAGYDPPQTEQFYDDVSERLVLEPSVASVAWATNAPLFGGLQRTVYLEGRPRDEGARIFVTANPVDAGYFETLGIPLLHGRDFTPADRDDSLRVAIVNQAMVDQFLSETEPVGTRFEFYGDDGPREIVGVVATTKVGTLGEEPQPVIYTPRRQDFADAMVLHVRSRGDAAVALASAQRVLREIDSTVPAQNTWTIRELVDQSLWGAKMAGVLLGIMGALALALASVGLYGVMAYTVSQRNREIGLRMALGAEQHAVLTMVLKHAMALVGVGIAIGLVLAFLTSGLVQSVLYGAARDPWTFFGVSVALALVAFVATLVPAIRASQVDPLEALRYQ